MVAVFFKIILAARKNTIPCGEFMGISKLHLMLYVMKLARLSCQIHAEMRVGDFDELPGTLSDGLAI